MKKQNGENKSCDQMETRMKVDKRLGCCNLSTYSILSHSNAFCLIQHSLFILHSASVAYTFFHTSKQKNRAKENIYIFFILLSDGVNCHVCVTFVMCPHLCTFVVSRFSVRFCISKFWFSFTAEQFFSMTIFIFQDRIWNEPIL